jgi:hypothetical protein
MKWQQPSHHPLKWGDGWGSVIEKFDFYPDSPISLSKRGVFRGRLLETREGDGVGARIGSHSVPRARYASVPVCVSMHKRQIEVPADAKS